MSRRALRIARIGLTIIAAGFGLALAAEAHSIFLGRNWHEVVPGRIYRCAQLGADDLRAQIARHGIRTVVNLRGSCVGFDWYTRECRATSTSGVSQEDLTLSATRLPAPCELRRFVEVLDGAEFPILLHCRQGVDRTGLMATTALLLVTDDSLESARRQLSLRFGHVSLGPTRIMGRFFELYEEWLQQQGIEHSRDHFRRWACFEYCPDNCRGTLTLLDGPASFRAGDPIAMPIRVTNTSIYDWVLHPGTETGIHVRFMVFTADGVLLQVGRAGQFEARVAPGESLELTLAINPLPAPGPYHLLADLQDRNQWAFSQLGSEPIELDFEVKDR